MCDRCVGSLQWWYWWTTSSVRRVSTALRVQLVRVDVGHLEDEMDTDEELVVGSIRRKEREEGLSRGTELDCLMIGERVQCKR